MRRTLKALLVLFVIAPVSASAIVATPTDDLCNCSFIVVARVQRVANWVCLPTGDIGHECDSRHGQLTIRVLRILGSPSAAMVNPNRHRPAAGESLLIQTNIETQPDKNAARSLPLTIVNPGLGQLDKLLLGKNFVFSVDTEGVPGEDDSGHPQGYSSWIWPMRLESWARHTIGRLREYCPRPTLPNQGTGDYEGVVF